MSAVPDDVMALAWTDMPSYGKIDWMQLREAVAEANVGDRTHVRELDERFYVGHQMVEGINYNSLNRIVTAFVLADRAARPSEAASQVPADGAQEHHEWPNGCIKPSSCGRHRACLYAQKPEHCRHFDRDIEGEVLVAGSRRAAAPDQEGPADGK